jgi:hypothetical protein
MFHRLTARLLLACYGVIALFGQGLHEWIDDDDCCGDAVVATAVVADSQPSSGLQVSDGEPNGRHHDCDHCPICQHESLGQLFVAVPVADFVLRACELISPSAPESVICPALFSSAQPRAPPAVV